MSKKILLTIILLIILLMSCGSQGAENNIYLSSDDSTSSSVPDTSNTRPFDTPATVDRVDIAEAERLIDKYCTNENNDDPDDDWPDFGCGVIAELRWGRGPQPGDVKSGFWVATVIRKGGIISVVTNISDSNISSEIYFAKFPLGSVIKWDRDGDNDTAAYDEIEMMYAGNGAMP